MDNDEKLLQYIDGVLTEQDLNAFEQLLQQDAALRQRADRLLLARDAVKLYGLKAQVASVHHQMMEELQRTEISETKRSYPFVRNLMKIAACLFVAICFFGAYEFATLSSKKLYRDKYSTYQTALNRDVAGEVSEIEKAYATGNFSTVVTWFEKTSQPTVKERFLAAQAYLSLHQPVIASTQFKAVLQSGDDTFKDDAEYYLALNYLNQDQPALARPILEKIYEDPDHLYHERVTWFMLLQLDILIKKNHH